MTRPLAAILACTLLLAVPSASAWPWDPLTVRVHETRVGDLWSYDSPSGSGTSTTVLLVEGLSNVADKYGEPHEVVALRVDSLHDGAFSSSERCLRLADGQDIVRVDLLAGEPDAWSSTHESSSMSLVGSRTTQEESVLTSRFQDWCPLSDPFSGREFREGDRVLIGDLYPDEDLPEVLSLPARKTTFAERPALSIFYGREEMAAIFETPIGEVPEDASFEMIFAHDLPGPALMRFRGDGESDEMALQAFTPGTGEIVPTGSATIPERDPEGEWAAVDPLRFDDRAFAMPFPYDEAFAALLADPNANAQAWFDANPDAFLAGASFEPAPPSGEPVTLSGRGSWMGMFLSQRSSVSWIVSSTDAVATPLMPLASPAPRYSVGFSVDDPATGIPSPPAELLTSRSALALANAFGVEPAPRIWFWGSTLQLTNIDPNGDDQEGTTITIDLVSGGLFGLYASSFRSEESGLLAGGIGGGIAPATSADGAWSALPAPGGLATAGAALTGAGLLGLLLKFLVAPLFTRLRRDRLLDNPVRARLYDRIRREPGIHRAELVDFAAIGEGATRHHLAQLAKHKLVVELEQDGFVRYFAAGEVPPDIARRESTLRAGSQRAVYDLYASEPSISLREAGARLGMSAPSVHRAKKKLEKAGLLPAAPTASVAEA